MAAINKEGEIREITQVVEFILGSEHNCGSYHAHIRQKLIL